MTPTPSGRRSTGDGTTSLVLTREFAAPISDVWAAVTESERLGRWIGTWTGDPASGRVEFTMTSEGDDVEPEPYLIDACEPPRRLVVRTRAGDEEWLLTLELDETDGTTTLTFAQALSDPTAAENVGPGWEYYLDRMVVAENGGAVEDVVWEDYYPAQSDYYRNLFA